MTRIVDFEDMPTRVKTSPLHSQRKRASWSEDEIRASYRKESKYKEQKHRIRRDKISNHLEA